MRYRYQALFLGALLICGSTSYGLLETFKWKVISQDNNIVVYKSEQAYGDTGLVPVKAEVLLDHRIERVLTVLTDVKRKKEWMPNAVESKLIERESIAQSVEYIHYSSPWPFKDRAFLIKNKGVYNPKTQTVNVEFSSVDHPLVEKTKNHIRGNTLEGRMTVQPVDSGKKTKLVMSFISDFKGVIPGWVMNIVQRKWPYGFMAGLNEQLQKEDIVINKIFLSVPEIAK